MERVYRIFGKNIKLNTIDNDSGEILHSELSLYPIIETKEFDVLINYVDHVELPEVLSINPAINYFSSDSILCKLGVATSRFYFKNDDIVQIDFSLEETSKLKNVIKKWKSIQFATDLEAIGQIVHELVLVPLAFIFDDYSVVHCSGIINTQGEAVLFGGTGGVGKTSLEMALCLEHESAFFNDDIAVLDTKGNCFPNFSYPKIYGYNLQGASHLKKRIINSVSMFDRLHYALHSLKGKNKVRRRVNPKTFYGKVFNKAKKISSFIILFRSNVDEITMESITDEKAAILNSRVISSEYNVFFDHLRWHSFNAISLGKNPLSTFNEVIEKNTRNFRKSLSIADNVYLAHIPIDISNKDFKNQMIKVLKDHTII